MTYTRLLTVIESSQVGEARRLAASMSRELGFDDVRIEHVSIVVSELATNLVKHAGGGDLVFRAIDDDVKRGIEVLSLDKGPGIDNMGECLHDGHSTKGSPGNGMGAIQRLSSEFDIYSRPGYGTAVLSCFWQNLPAVTTPAHSFELGAVCLPVLTDIVCGDAWAHHQTSERLLVMVADGLGHGPDAAEASTAAVNTFKNYCMSSPPEMIERLHAALSSTRGAAVSITEVLNDQQLVRHCGVGNITGRIIANNTVRNMVSYNGIVGYEARKITEFTYPWPQDGLLVLHSDGLATHWNLDDYPGLSGRNPVLIAGVLYRDHNRVRDDSTVVIVKESKNIP